jgi:IPT/TIG domain
MLWEIGLSKILASQATHCSYDNSTCYISKTVPVIYNISANEGYYTGGQYLTVKGYGFSKGTIDTKVDGVNCQVVNRKEEEFTCRLDAASSVSTVDVPKVGGPGIRRTLVNGTSSDTVGWGNLLNANLSLHPQWEIEDSVSMQLESPINIDN